MIDISSVVSGTDGVSYACWPFVYLFQRNIPVGSNAYFNGSLILICFKCLELLIHSEDEPLVKYMYCKYSFLYFRLFLNNDSSLC